MKTLLKLLVLSAVCFSGASMATMTKEQCLALKDASWTQTFGSHGMCSIPIANPRGTGPVNISQTECEAIPGGVYGADKICRVPTKGITVKTQPMQKQ